MKLIVATTNPGKLRELRELLPDEIEVASWASLGIEAPEETGQTFLDNATLKAQHAARSGHPAIADDSGLEVDALGGKPGVRSARFAGPEATDADNNQRLIELLQGSADRTARFQCAVVLALPDGTLVSATGALEGLIIAAPRGSGGFGYDPHFEVHDEGAPEATGRTLAELPLSMKNAISHRARAYGKLANVCSTMKPAHPIIAALGSTAAIGGHSR